ncbi:hypothetical protein DN492_30555 [Burkholderia multivorans]|nr:hypothetical protein DN492_30555 [Burkholderia multivorans]
MLLRRLDIAHYSEALSLTAQSPHYLLRSYLAALYRYQR